MGSGCCLSEVPQLWRSALQRWRVINRRSKRNLDDAAAPDSNEEYLFYQTLLGTWPIDAEGRAELTVGSEYIERLQAYMAKALKEAKVNTSWIQPNEAWDSAMSDFVDVRDPREEQVLRLPAGCGSNRAAWRQFALQCCLSSPLLGAEVIREAIFGTSAWSSGQPAAWITRQRGNMLAAWRQLRRKSCCSNAGRRIKLLLTQRCSVFGASIRLVSHGKSALTVTDVSDCCIAFARELKANGSRCSRRGFLRAWAFRRLARNGRTLPWSCRRSCRAKGRGSCSPAVSFDQRMVRRNCATRWRSSLSPSIQTKQSRNGDLKSPT